MRESLFSPIWYRYSQQRPLLRAHTSVQPQKYRDQLWYLLINDTNGHHYRINHVAYAFIGRCDGHFNVQEVWESLLAELGDEALTQDEVIQLLTELDHRDLLRYEAIPDIPRLFKRKKLKDKQTRKQFVNPLAFRLPLWNPSTFLNRAKWLQKALFNPATFLLWLVAVATGLLSASVHFDELARHAQNYMTTPHYLLITWLVFPVVKAIHELGHGLAVHRWGGQAKEAGITFFVLTPAPYVDASASTAFRSRYQRMLVGAIGIMIELFIAAIALSIWLSTQAGLMHDIAFVTLFICGVSSIVFNGNPLLRFDAYYMLCDAFDLPNLAARSRSYWTQLLTQLALNRPHHNTMPLAHGEKKWLIAYAPLSFLYSLTLMAYIVTWISTQSLILGAVLLLFVIAGVAVQPVRRLIQNILSSAQSLRSKRRAKLLLTTFALTLLALFFLVPVPHTTTAQGVVWVPEQAQIRPNTDGFIKTIHVQNGTLVKPKQLLIELDDPQLEAKRQRLQNQYAALEVEQYQALLNQPERANSINQSMDKISAEIAQIDEKIEHLKIYSQVEGRFVMPYQADYEGWYAKKGKTIAYVLDPKLITLRVAIPESEVQLVRDQQHGIEVVLADQPHTINQGQLVHDTPAATRQLPSAALGKPAGGAYMVDPTDKDGLTTVTPIAIMDVQLPHTALSRVGTRAIARFSLESTPIAVQLFRHIKQQFLQLFNPAT